MIPCRASHRGNCLLGYLNPTEGSWKAELHYKHTARKSWEPLRKERGLSSMIIVKCWKLFLFLAFWSERFTCSKVLIMCSGEKFDSLLLKSPLKMVGRTKRRESERDWVFPLSHHSLRLTRLPGRSYCLISNREGLGTSLYIMGLETIDPHSQKEHTEIHKIPKLGVNYTSFYRDRAI